jgi:PhzF family phenazine biosynthesis protein
MSRPLRLVDVFRSGPLSGNPLGVVLDGAGLTDAEMLRLTQWLNFSETTFLFPPDDAAADYKVRIFTPDRELPFAGHPTLGTCHAWLEAGGTPKRADRIVQSCGVGLVEIKREGERLAFAAPPLVRSGPPSAAELDDALGILGISREAIVDCQWIDNGPGWLGVLLPSAEAVLALQPRSQRPGRIEIGVIGPAENVDFELRGFFTDHNGALREDPVTGSLNASAAQWMFASGRAKGSYVAAQGTALGAAGRIYLSQDENGQVWVGGENRTVASGTLGA